MILNVDDSGGGPRREREAAKGQACLALPLDSANHFEVVASGDFLVIQKCPVGRLSRPEAVNLAAWLMLQADPDGKEFARLVKEIVK